MLIIVLRVRDRHLHRQPLFLITFGWISGCVKDTTSKKMLSLRNRPSFLPSFFSFLNSLITIILVQASDIVCLETCKSLLIALPTSITALRPTPCAAAQMSLLRQQSDLIRALFAPQRPPTCAFQSPVDFWLLPLCLSRSSHRKFLITQVTAQSSAPGSERHPHIHLPTHFPVML